MMSPMAFRVSILGGLAAVILAMSGPPATADSQGAVLLIDIQAGDRACYLTVRAGGRQQSLMADFELCPGGAHDASKLLRRQVRVTKVPRRVTAASCMGDMDCKKFDMVDLVIGLMEVH